MKKSNDLARFITLIQIKVFPISFSVAGLFGTFILGFGWSLEYETYKVHHSISRLVYYRESECSLAYGVVIVKH